VISPDTVSVMIATSATAASEVMKVNNPRRINGMQKDPIYILKIDLIC